jgi:hypothetical protein
MSQKERVVASFEQITLLCFQILRLVVEDKEKKAVSTFLTCISSSESGLTAMSPPFVQKKRKKFCIFDSAPVLVTPVCSGYIGALTEPKPSVSAKLEHHLLYHRLFLLLCNMQYGSSIPCRLERCPR